MAKSKKTKKDTPTKNVEKSVPLKVKNNDVIVSDEGIMNRGYLSVKLKKITNG